MIDIDKTFDSYDIGKTTLRKYLKELLLELWREGEQFSGKRPLGSSGWEYNLADDLADAGLIKDRNNVFEAVEEAINSL